MIKFGVNNYKMDKPIKKKVVRKKKEAPKQPEMKIVELGKGNIATMDGNVDPELLNFLQKAFASSRKLSPEDQILHRDMGVLESVVTEYLKAFLIIGYDTNGEKITITHATNASEGDALVEHARGTLLSILMKAQQNLPGMGP